MRSAFRHARKSAAVNGRCDFCPRLGRLAMCMCLHEHRVGVWVCAEKHERDLGTVDIACRLCYEKANGYVTALHEV